MRKAIIVILPIIFTAQACNFLFGDLYGEQGSGSRGVFWSVDGGQTWQEAKQAGKEQSLGGVFVSQIVFESGKPNNMLAASSNAGVYASDNNGQTWQVLLSGFSAHDAFINPNNGEEIFAAGSSGKIATIYKSTDRGATWVQIYNEPAGQAAVTTLSYDSRNPAIMYAGLSSGTLLKTVDGGTTWNALYDYDDRVVRLHLSADGNTLYLLGRGKGLRRSEDGGKTWSEMPVAKENLPTVYNDLLIDPVSQSILYLAADKGLYRSSNRGADWVKLTLPATPEITDVTAVAVNPQKPQQIFAAVRSTVYRSDDSGSSWSTQALKTGRVVSKIAIDPVEPNRVYAGLK